MTNTHFLAHTFDSMPEAVVIADTSRRIISVNKAFEAVFGYSKDEAIGKETSFLYAYPNDFEKAGERTFNSSTDSETKKYEVLYRKKDGLLLIGDTTANVVKDNEGDIIGFLGIIRDVTSERKQEEELSYLSKQFHTLVDITTGEKEDISTKIEKALRLTTDFLGLEIGIVSTIHEDTYTVEHFYPVSSGLNKGDTFNMGETYCDITVKSDDVVAIDHMANTEFNVHPCYSKFQLETYIGMPLIIRGEVRGTINFSSSKPNSHPFSDSDKDMMRALAKWLSSIIDQHEVEEELKESRERYRLISERSLDLVCLHKPDGTYEYLSPSVERILGYTQDDLIGKNPYELFHPDDIKMIEKESHRQSVEGKRVISIEYRIRNKNGDYIWFDTSTEPIVDGDGNLTGLQTSSRDVTDRKRLEILFNQSQTMASVGGWEYDLTTGKLYWTDEVYHIHEKDPSDEVYVEEGMSYYPDDGTREILQEALDKTMETGVPTDLELDFITAKGNKKVVHTIINAMRADGEAYKLYGTFQDITERTKVSKSIQEKIRQLNTLLETTHQINSIIGHDLRNPLTSIIGLIDIMLMDMKGDKKNIPFDEFYEYLNMMRSSSLNMNQLLIDLFSWSRVQTGLFEVKKEKLNLFELIQPTIELMQASAKEKDIQLSFHCDQDIEVSVDKTIIPTIARNFVSNAIKFTPENGQVALNCERNGKSVTIAVRDTGEGMDTHTLRSLFHPIYHPSTNGTNDEKGTGLGLKLSKQLAELHGSKISVDSALGEGSTFSLIVPNE